MTGLLASCPIFSGAGDRNQASRCQGALARIVPAASPETCGFGETRRFTAPMGCRDQSFAASLGSHPRCHAKNGPCTRARTGKPEGGRFSYHFDFRRRPPGRSWSGLSLGPSAICALGPARLVSTPSARDADERDQRVGAQVARCLPRRTFVRRAWLGIATGMTREVSPNLSSSTPAVSNGALTGWRPASLLCLPISPCRV